MEHDEEHDGGCVCHTQGLIWVDDTSARGMTRLQKEFDGIGPIMPKFTIRPFASFASRKRDELGIPLFCQLIEHRHKDEPDKVRVQHYGSPDRWAFDLSGLHKCAPYNNLCLADMFLRYERLDDGRIAFDRERSHQYFSAMRLSRLETFGMLAEPGQRRERGVVALVEERAGLVLPLPLGCVVSWMHFGDGSGVEIAVYDGAAMRRRMDLYPEYFDDEAVPNDDDIERDIAGCVDVITRLESGTLSQSELRNAMPRYPFAERCGNGGTIKERN